MAYQRYLLITFCLSLLLGFSTDSLSAQDNNGGAVLPATVVGIRGVQGGNAVTRRVINNNSSNNVPLTLGFILGQNDVVQVPVGSEVAVSCGNGDVLIFGDSGDNLGSINLCNGNVEAERSPFLWGNIEIRRVNRSTSIPEIIHPGLSFVSTEPEFIEWYFDESPYVQGTVSYNVELLDQDYQFIARWSDVVGSRIDISDVDFNFTGTLRSYHVFISATGQDIATNNVSPTGTNSIEFCITGAIPSAAPDVSADDEWASDWMDSTTLDFMAAQAAFLDGYYARALGIMLAMNPPLLPVNYDPSLDISAMADATSLVKSPAYYTLLGDLYHNLSVPTLAGKSYKIAEVLAITLSDDLTLASIYVRQAEVSRGLNSTLGVNDIATQNYDAAIALYDRLGYEQERNAVATQRDNSGIRTQEALCSN